MLDLIKFFNYTTMKEKKADHIKRVTVEKLRTYKGFENVTDEEAEKQIETIKTLAKILFRMYENDNREAKK